MFLADQVECDPRVQAIFGSHAIDALLHFAMSTVPAFDGIGGRGEQLVVEKSEGLVEIRGEQFVQCLADPLKTTHAASELGEFGPRCIGAAASVKQAVHFIHDFPEGAKLRLTTGNPTQRGLFRRSQLMLNEQMPAFKQIGDLAGDSLLGARGSFRSPRGRASSRELWHLRGQLLTDLGHRAQHGFGQFCDHVKFTDLVRDCAENLGNRPRIQGRTVCRDSPQRQAPRLQGGAKPHEERRDVGLFGAVIENLVQHPLERPVIH